MRGITRSMGILALALGLASFASASPLEEIRTSVAREVRAGRTPIVVFNIDGTILDNRSRSQAILRDFVKSNPDSCAGIADSIHAMREEEIDYFIIESFNRCGIRNLFLVESALKFWADNFFTNNYVKMDVPIAGAVRYITELHDSGAMIVYISGRNRANMLEGTVAALGDKGFPIATPRTLLVMKPNPRDNNAQFKENAYLQIAKLGRVVGAFENEARDANAMRRAWPRASVVLLRAAPSHTVAPLNGVRVINSYTY